MLLPDAASWTYTQLGEVHVKYRVYLDDPQRDSYLHS